MHLFCGEAYSVCQFYKLEYNSCLLYELADAVAYLSSHNKRWLYMKEHILYSLYEIYLFYEIAYVLHISVK